MIILTIFQFIVQLFALILFCIISSYVFCLGKAGTGIKLDYWFFALICGVVFFLL